MQEWVEAVTFHNYLTKGRLSEYIAGNPHRDPTRSPTDPEATSKSLAITEDDYILGICDLTGEIMRYAITAMATDGALLKTYDVNAPDQHERSSVRNILSDLRSLSAHLESLVTNSSSGAQTPLTGDLQKKLEVTRTSVEKVEKAAYGLAIRGRERPKGWMPDMSTGRGPGTAKTEMEGVESY